MGVVKLVILEVNVLQVALISSFAEARGGRSTATHMRLSLRIALTDIEDLPTPLDQVTSVPQRVKQIARPVSDILLVKLKPPVTGVLILQYGPKCQSIKYTIAILEIWICRMEM